MGEEHDGGVNHITLEEELAKMVQRAIACPVDPLQAHRVGSGLVRRVSGLKNVGCTSPRVPQEDCPPKNGGSLAECCFPWYCLAGAELQALTDGPFPSLPCHDDLVLQGRGGERDP